MLNSLDLIATASRLITVGSAGLPSEADMRRAVSTAYYAVFHCLMGAAANRFVGQGDNAQATYALVYRAIDHARAAAICRDLCKETLSPKMQEHLGMSSADGMLKELAEAFCELQRRRMIADYHPLAHIDLEEAVDLVEQANLAVFTFSLVPPAELTAVLALMLVRPRG